MNRKEVEILKQKYPPGTKIRLFKMDDFQAPPPGKIGIITHIDDAGTIHWTGSGLGIIPGEDLFEVVGCDQE